MQAQLPACPACDEAVGFDDQFCESCGASLAEEPEPAEPQTRAPAVSRRTKVGGPRARAAGKARSNRRAVSSELSRALKSVRVLRTFFVINAVLHLIATAASVAGFGSTGGDRSLFVVSLAIQASMSAIMLAGVFLVMHQPAVWALVMACIVTLSRLMSAWEYDWNIGVLGLGAIWSLMLWALVAPAARAKRLMDENPDLAFAKKLENQRPRAVRNASLAGGGVVVVSVAAAFFLHVGSAAVPLGPSWASFVEDWKANRGQRVLDWVEAGMSEGEAVEFEAEARARGWLSQLPTLGADAPGDLDRFPLYTVEDLSSAYVEIECETDQGGFTFVWVYRPVEKDWLVGGIEYPMAEFPQELEDRLRLIWENSDIDGLAAMFENPERARGTVGRAFERRGWEREFPELKELVVESGARGTNIYFLTDDGDSRPTMRRAGGKWPAASFRPPSRN